jgi:hypothetical protein
LPLIERWRQFSRKSISGGFHGFEIRVCVLFGATSFVGEGVRGRTLPQASEHALPRTQEAIVEPPCERAAVVGEIGILGRELRPGKYGARTTDLLTVRPNVRIVGVRLRTAATVVEGDRRNQERDTDERKRNLAASALKYGNVYSEGLCASADNGDDQRRSASS